LLSVNITAFILTHGRMVHGVLTAISYLNRPYTRFKDVRKVASASYIQLVVLPHTLGV